MINTQERKCAIYLRSPHTTKQIHPMPLLEQEQICRTQAHRLGYTDDRIKVYREIEKGKTAHLFYDRPLANELRGDIWAGRIERVIVVDYEKISHRVTENFWLATECVLFDCKLTYLNIHEGDQDVLEKARMMASVYRQMDPGSQRAFLAQIHLHARFWPLTKRFEPKESFHRW